MSERLAERRQIQVPFLARAALWVGLAMFAIGLFQRGRVLGGSEFSGMAAFMALLWISVPGFGLVLDSLLFRLNVRLCEGQRPEVRNGGESLALALAVVNFFFGSALLLASLLWVTGPFLSVLTSGVGDAEVGDAEVGFAIVGFFVSLFFFGYPVLLIAGCGYFGVRFVQLQRGALDRREKDASEPKNSDLGASVVPEGTLKDQADTLRKENLTRVREGPEE